MRVIPDRESSNSGGAKVNNKMWFLVGAIIACLIASAVLPVPQVGAQKTITIVDSAGREVEIPQPLERIAVHYPNLLEVIIALDAEETVIGVADSVAAGQDKILQRFSGKPGIGVGAGPRASVNIEKLTELNPQVLLVMSGASRLEKELEPLGIQVVELSCNELDTLAQEIALLGKMLGREKEAQQYVAFFQTYLELVDQRLRDVKEEEKPRVYLEFFSDYTTQGRGSPGDMVVSRAGGNNVAAILRLPFPAVNSEWVVRQNPDVIIRAQLPMFAPSGYMVTDPSAMDKLRGEIMERPEWKGKEMKAVETSRVYVINSDLWTSPRVPLGALYTAKCLYPDRFQDVDPDEVHREWLRKFYGLEEGGIWFWPELE